MMELRALICVFEPKVKGHLLEMESITSCQGWGEEKKHMIILFKNAFWIETVSTEACLLEVTFLL